MTPLELLSPARDAAIGRRAILAGADAVYIGAPAFGARAAATNTVEDIRGLATFAHRYGARVYVTMNTILYDSELAAARDLVWQLYAAGVDALIVQDMAYLGMDLPPIALHSSTQCDIRTVEKARILADAGFSQLVLPRELSLDEIAAIRSAVDVPVEVFVHGALCVSYSGDCQAGFVAMGRSANRGECPQMCRLPYRLTDAADRDVAPERHYLSLRDLNNIANLPALAQAGASSFKIEGRLKDEKYVVNVTAAYRDALDRLIAAEPDRYCRSSFGQTTRTFHPDLEKTFNRGYTDYFVRGRRTAMASLDTPKWTGVPVGTVSRVARSGHELKVRLSAILANGDGLGYFDASGRFHGFRLNRIDGDTLYPATPQPDIPVSATLYRNGDKAFSDSIDSAIERRIALDMTIRDIDGTAFELTGTDEGGNTASIVARCEPAVARTPQDQVIARNLGRLGDSIYLVRDVRIECGDRFIPASVLADARRQLITAMEYCSASRYRFDRRKVSRLAPDAFAAYPPLSYHDNVANALSDRFYRRHGARIAQRAIEVDRPGTPRTVVMTTRYCIRRELGACLRTPAADRLPSELYLVNPTGRYRLDFDCERCGMKVVKVV